MLHEARTDLFFFSTSVLLTCLYTNSLHLYLCICSRKTSYARLLLLLLLLLLLSCCTSCTSCSDDSSERICDHRPKCRRRVIWSLEYNHQQINSCNTTRRDNLTCSPPAVDAIFSIIIIIITPYIFRNTMFGILT